MKVTAWNKGNHSSDGNGYGVKIKAHDRGTFFRREWMTILLELEGENIPADVNIDKDSFWTETCGELISVRIGKWLRKNKLAPWEKGNPPELNLTPVEGNRFCLTRS
jgi:uncharacterized protein YfaT (DUF1175 family)